MLAATIVPQPYLNLIKDQPYHLALAHLIDKPGFEIYTSFYFDVGYSKHRFLILDNGLIEGDPRPIEELIEKATMLNAEEVVMPDVFQNKDETLNAAHDAWDYFQYTTKRRAMIVPQGSTYEEWLECAREMLTWGAHTISIPKVVTKMTQGVHGRLQALIDLQEEIVARGVEVHLLGCWETPLELKYIEVATRNKIIQPVRGVDSAIAYVYARAGLKMSEDERPKGAIDFAANDADVEILKYNIEMWQSECAALGSPAEYRNQPPKIW